MTDSLSDRLAWEVLSFSPSLSFSLSLSHALSLSVWVYLSLSLSLSLCLSLPPPSLCVCISDTKTPWSALDYPTAVDQMARYWRPSLDIRERDVSRRVSSGMLQTWRYTGLVLCRDLACKGFAHRPSQRLDCYPGNTRQR